MKKTLIAKGLKITSETYDLYIIVIWIKCLNFSNGLSDKKLNELRATLERLESSHSSHSSPARPEESSTSADLDDPYLEYFLRHDFVALLSETINTTGITIDQLANVFNKVNSVHEEMNKIEWRTTKQKNLIDSLLTSAKDLKLYSETQLTSLNSVHTIFSNIRDFYVNVTMDMDPRPKRNNYQSDSNGKHINSNVKSLTYGQEQCTVFLWNFLKNLQRNKPKSDSSLELRNFNDTDNSNRVPSSSSSSSSSSGIFDEKKYNQNRMPARNEEDSDHVVSEDYELENN